MSTQNSPHNETRPVYRLSESVPGDEPVRSPKASDFPCEMYDYMWHEVPCIGHALSSYAYWRPSQPERAGNKIPCPHCGSTILWSEDRGAHCDGCDDFDPKKDIPAFPSSQMTESAKPDERANKCAYDINGELRWALNSQQFDAVAKTIARHYAPVPAPIAKLVAEQKPCPPEMRKAINEHFWYLFDDPPAPSTPEGLREKLLTVLGDVWRDEEDPSGALARIITILRPFIPASTTEGRT